MASRRSFEIWPLGRVRGRPEFGKRVVYHRQRHVSSMRSVQELSEELKEFGVPGAGFVLVSGG